MYESATRHGLIHTHLVARSVPDTRVLARDARRGVLIRLRRGVYVRADQFAAVTARERHVLRVRAADACAQSPIVAAGVSAAALWQAPDVMPWPDEVTVLDRWRGGGRSDPGLRRTAADRDSAEIRVVDGIHATALPRTVLHVARRLPFEAAVGLLDWAIGPRCNALVSRDELWDDLALMGPQTPRRHLARLIEFASPLSESVGESRTRALVRMLGLALPEEQMVLGDDDGVMRVDFAWPRERVVLEFDGRIKYGPGVAGDVPAAEVVWREKLREDRIRQLGYRVVRVVWSDLMRPERFRSRLLAAGVPSVGRGG